MYVLGISAFYHDSAACLLRDGEILAAAQEERFSRRKGDAAFPAGAVEYCLAEAGIGPRELDAVGFYEKPLLKFERILETYLSVAPRGFRSFRRAGPLWLREKLDTERRIRRALGYDGPLLFSEHHEAHAASAFFPSPFPEAAILTMDGVGEWATATIGVGRGNEIEILQELRWPDSPGLLYSAFTSYLGFEVNGGEYKVMGLAPYGRPGFERVILDKLVDLREDGSFRLNRRYFGYLTGLTMTSAAFHDLFGGPPRAPGAEITQRHKDIAWAVQAVLEEIVLCMARQAHRESAVDNLCLAGGVALNGVANGRVVREGPFRRVWVQPAAGDAGGALGVAQLAWYRHMGNDREDPAWGDAMRGALLGPAYGAPDIQRGLEALGARFRQVDDVELLPQVAARLDRGQVIGWFSGRMEYGPRALGARSILADPRPADMQARLNERVKRREAFRPFAPSIPVGRAPDYFALETDSPYMSLVVPVQPDRGIPAVTHVDGSARVQTVDPEVHPRFHALLREFERQTGCGVLVNTSFNVRDEPIVCTPEDAYRCFLEAGLDALVLESFLLERDEQPPLTLPPPAAARPGLLRRAWRALGAGLGMLTTPVLLGAVYLVVMAPAGFLLRFLGRDPLRPPRGVSQWRTRDTAARRSDLTRQF